MPLPVHHTPQICPMLPLTSSERSNQTNARFLPLLCLNCREKMITYGYPHVKPKRSLPRLPVFSFHSANKGARALLGSFLRMNLFNAPVHFLHPLGQQFPRFVGLLHEPIIAVLTVKSPLSRLIAPLEPVIADAIRQFH